MTNTKHILVIEDDDRVRQMICNILEREGYLPVQATNGIEGLRALRHITSFSLVITDILMPEKEGIETIREIRNDFPWIRILAISGGGILIPENYLNLAKSMGADAILCKPFGKKELLHAVESLYT